MPAPPDASDPTEQSPFLTDGPPPRDPPDRFPYICEDGLTRMARVNGDGKIAIVSGPLKGASDLVPPSDPITTDEAEEEMNDREAAELAAREAAEALAESQPGAKPTWGELFTSDEADREFKLNFLDRVSVITNTFVKSVDTPDGESDLKFLVAKYVPERLEKAIINFLCDLNRSGSVIAREIGKEVGDNG